jgi:hypothetical protein
LRTLKSIIGLFRAVVPVAYCGSLFYYFLGFGGSIDDLKTTGLWPTVVGVGIVGLLFCIPLLLKIVGVVFALRSRGPGGPDGEAFDADAVIARYKAHQSPEPAPSIPAPPPVRRTPDDPRPTFGRRTR